MFVWETIKKTINFQGHQNLFDLYLGPQEHEGCFRNGTTRARRLLKKNYLGPDEHEGCLEKTHLSLIWDHKNTNAAKTNWVRFWTTRARRLLNEFYFGPQEHEDCLKKIPGSKHIVKIVCACGCGGTHSLSRSWLHPNAGRGRRGHILFFWETIKKTIVVGAYFFSRLCPKWGAFLNRL